MRAIIQRSLIIFILSLCVYYSHAQLSIGGIPPGFNNEQYKSTLQTITLTSPDYESLKRQDDSVSSMGVPERMGIAIDTYLTPDNSGNWVDISDNESTWRLNIKIDGAIGLGLYFDEFELNDQDKLFVYSADRTHLIGAFTKLNNRPNGLFATEPVKGESIIIELVHKKNADSDSRFSIREIMVVYTPMKFTNSLIDNSSLQTKGVLGDSDECEVSTKCPEGDNWRDQINGVVRIMVKIGGTAYWCTGSVMNNTALDFSPLVLTADHCANSNGTYASAANVAQWIFFFRHEALSCDNDTPIGTRSLTGAVKLASSSPQGNDGSDFYLLELLDNIPGSYEPFFMGWNARNIISNSGVAIHHPAGDVKKISTYSSPLEFSQWGNIPETHFLVQWIATQNGHGVTEGGSSGCPLLNSEGLVIGQLTGGESDCTNLTGNDFFGRLYYSWDKNGTHDSVMLEPWLDPLNTGLQVIDGSYNTKAAIAQFAADEVVIPVGSYIQYTNLSQNNPTEWNWYFEGGEPSVSSANQPEPVFYDHLGRFEVVLAVSNEFGVDTMSLEVSVVPVIYPNPTRNDMHVLLGDDIYEHEILINDITGRIIGSFLIPQTSNRFDFSFLGYPAGLYIITIKSPVREEHYKLIYSPL